MKLGLPAKAVVMKQFGNGSEEVAVTRGQSYEVSTTGRSFRSNFPFDVTEYGFSYFDRVHGAGQMNNYLMPLMLIECIVSKKFHPFLGLLHKPGLKTEETSSILTTLR